MSAGPFLQPVAILFLILIPSFPTQDLEKALQSDDPQMRLQAIQQLAADLHPVEVCIPLLERVIRKDPEAYVQEEAMAALGRKGAAAVAPLQKFLRGADTSPRLAGLAARALGEAGSGTRPEETDERNAAADALLRAISDHRWYVRESAVLALRRLGPESSPGRIKLLLGELEVKEYRLHAARAFVELTQRGPEVMEAIPPLLTMLQCHENPAERVAAAEALGAVARADGDVVAALMSVAGGDTEAPVRRAAVEALESQIEAPGDVRVALLHRLRRDDDPSVRRTAASVLGRIGIQESKNPPSDLVDVLRDALRNDRAAEVRYAAARALGMLRLEPEVVVPALAREFALTEDRNLRKATVDALKEYGPQAREAIPTLLAKLDLPEENDRWDVIVALGRIGAAARPAIPGLIARLEDESATVRRGAATALARIANGLLAEKSIDCIPELERARIAVETYVQTHPGDDVTGFEGPPQEAIRKAAEALNRENQSDRILLVISGVLGILIIAGLLWLLVLYLKPLHLLEIGEAFRVTHRYILARLPPIFPLRELSHLWEMDYLSRLFFCPARALDAWVTASLPVARSRFAEKQIVKERRPVVPLGLEGAGRTVIDTPARLRPLFKVDRACLLLWGRAGTGKTTWACQIALAGMETDADKGLGPHPMLPILLDPSSLGDSSSGHGFLEAVRRELQLLTGRTRTLTLTLIKELLRRRRLLILLDGYSEMPQDLRRSIPLTDPEVPLNALVITSRTEEALDGVPRTSLTPQVIRDSDLPSFLGAYLAERDRRTLFPDDQIQVEARQLARMAEDQTITPLLARLYAEQMIQAREQEGTELPTNIPSLLLLYVNWLNRVPPEEQRPNSQVQRDAKIVAWQCVRREFRPGLARRSEVLRALRRVSTEDPETRLSYLERRLQLIRTLGPAEDRIRFMVEPLAEYLAACHVVERRRGKKENWDTFLAQAQTLRGGSKSIQRFLLAVHECCLADLIDDPIPESVLQRIRELTQQIPPRVQSELEEARAQMTVLLPPDEPFERPGILIGHRRRQATTVSADFYGFLPRKDGTLGIYAVDGEGHGLRAANQARSLFQALTDSDREPWGQGAPREELLVADERVSKSAIFQRENAMYCMNFTEIDPQLKLIRHANAGMPFPLLYRHQEAQPLILRASGMHIGGGYAHFPTQRVHTEVSYRDGDLLVLVSDGVIEARDVHGITFGAAGVTRAVATVRDEPTTRIAEEILMESARHTGRLTPEDDQTVLVVRLGEPGPPPKTFEEHDGRYRLRNARDTVWACHYQLRERLETLAQEHSWANEDRVRQVWLTIWEAIQNAIRYGSMPGDVLKIQMVLPDDRDILKVELRQPRVWEAWHDYLGAARRREVNGKRFLMGGTVSMLWLADDLALDDQGRHLTLRFGPTVKPPRRVIPPTADEERVRY